MEFHSRSDWGARSPEGRSSIGSVYGCTVHWNGPSIGDLDHSRCDDIMRGFQDYHMDSNGWSDIGYNFVVCQHGHVYEGRGIGISGAHAGSSDIGGNDHWYGIQAMVGQGDAQPDALFAGLRDAINHCRQNGAGNRINGHRDHHATACPGDELHNWAHGSPMSGYGEEDDFMAMFSNRGEFRQFIFNAVLRNDKIDSGHEDNPQWTLETFVKNIQNHVSTRILDQVFYRVWRSEDAIPNLPNQRHYGNDNPQQYPEWALARSHYDANRARQYSWDNKKALDELTQSVAALSEGLNVTVDYEKIADSVVSAMDSEALAASIRKNLSGELISDLVEKLRDVGAADGDDPSS